jgi:hypothetical protein
MTMSDFRLGKGGRQEFRVQSREFRREKRKSGKIIDFSASPSAPFLRGAIDGKGLKQGDEVRMSELTKYEGGKELFLSLNTPSVDRPLSRKGA